MTNLGKDAVKRNKQANKQTKTCASYSTNVSVRQNVKPLIDWTMKEIGFRLISRLVRLLWTFSRYRHQQFSRTSPLAIFSTPCKIRGSGRTKHCCAGAVCSDMTCHSASFWSGSCGIIMKYKGSVLNEADMGLKGFNNQTWAGLKWAQARIHNKQWLT